MGRLQETLSNVGEESTTDDGRVAVVGGSVAYPNQPALVGRAALRTGSDHVRAFVAEPTYEIVTGQSPNLLVDRYAGERFAESAVDRALESDLSNAVLTPSGTEAEPIDEAYGSLEAFSEETGAVVTRTGGVDEIVTGGERIENETGTSALTVAGTGDTLAGIVASLLGQGMNRGDAAELGAWILGKSGELATAAYAPGVVATDVIERIPDTIR